MELFWSTYPKPSWRQWKPGEYLQCIRKREPPTTKSRQSDGRERRPTTGNWQMALLVGVGTNTAGQKLGQVRPSHVTDLWHLLACSSDIYWFFNMPNWHRLQHLGWRWPKLVFINNFWSRHRLKMWDLSSHWLTEGRSTFHLQIKPVLLRRKIWKYQIKYWNFECHHGLGCCNLG